jgi:sarcosine oxidase
MTDRPGVGAADVIVAGAGAMGSAAASALARRGARVFVVDPWATPHAHGSSHGRTRIIREAYFEHPAYVPLVQRAYERWAAMERASGRTLFRRTGALMLGPADGTLVAGALRSAREHGLPHEVLPANEVRRRFPGYEPPDGTVGVVEPRGGILFVEVCVETMLALARHHGAVVHFGERVTHWHAEGGGVSVTTTRALYRARRLVLAAGAWLPTLVPELGPVLAVERQLIHWFEPSAPAERFTAARAPVTIWEFAPGRVMYTIPDVGHGLKAAIHHGGKLVDPTAPREPVQESETREIRTLLGQLLPGANGRLLEATTCLYTNTPDGHFIVDAHPEHPEVILVSACSGHGFKFASAIGEMVAELALERESEADRSLFRYGRLATRGGVTAPSMLPPRAR